MNMLLEVSRSQQREEKKRKKKEKREKKEKKELSSNFKCRSTVCRIRYCGEKEGDKYFSTGIFSKKEYGGDYDMVSSLSK